MAGRRSLTLKATTVLIHMPCIQLPFTHCRLTFHLVQDQGSPYFDKYFETLHSSTHGKVLVGGGGVLNQKIVF